MLANLGLRLRVFLLFAGLGLGAVAALSLGLLFAYQRFATPAALNAFVQAGVVGGIGGLGLVAWVWYLFDVNVAKPIDLLAGALRARAHSDIDQALDEAPARYLGDLAPAASAAAARLSQTRNALAEAVARETTRLAAEKSRLEALLADVSVGVLLCSARHQLVFYNGAAVDLMGAAPGLDRALFDHLREGPVAHAYARLLAAGDSGGATDLLCSTGDGTRLLAARMRLLPDNGGVKPGYVLTLTDVTADLAATARQEALLAEVFDRVRRPAASLHMLLAALPDAVGLPSQLETALQAESAALTMAVNDLGQRHDETRSDSGRLTLTRSSDLFDSLRARLEVRGQALRFADPPPLLLRCNGFEVVALLDVLVQKLAETGGPFVSGPLALGLVEDGADALLRLEWQGAPLPISRLERWLDAAIDPAMPEITGHSVLLTHATEVWPETVGETAGKTGGDTGRDAAHDAGRDVEGETQAICLAVRVARRTGPRPEPVSRAVIYDFDLLSKERNADIADTPLADLNYVVFDTETTGLLPDQGDEIVQIAAVRIVNGRRVKGEVFDTLVNPGCPVPPASTKVHGITTAMVQGAPTPAEAVCAFHKFAEGAVLIAHNAPFDMAFLRRVEPTIGVHFDNPTLDTVLLSAVIFGQHEVHSLDALTHRLGITIPEEERHTAIGDTVATAQAFLKLLPMLQGRGLGSFGTLLSEVRRHGRLLKDLN